MYVKIIHQVDPDIDTYLLKSDQDHPDQIQIRSRSDTDQIQIRYRSRSDPYSDTNTDMYKETNIA